jgi:cell division protein ZapA (FtsZ GTPase activity inhibitor)
MAEEPRSSPGEYVTVEIYDQLYHLSGEDPQHIRDLAAYVDAKMRAVAAQAGKDRGLAARGRAGCAEPGR